MAEKIKLLYLCTGNSCRSQMAEGWTRHLKGDIIDVHSAGIETHGLNPDAVKVMAEAGVDISNQKSENVKDMLDIQFDYVVTVCSSAHETCPVFPEDARIIHEGFDDPPKMALDFEDEDEKLDCYRKVRDQIRAFVDTLPGALDNKTAGR